MEKTELRGRELVEKVIDPEIRKFSEVFQKISGTSITGMERELLRCYLYQKLTGEM